MHSSYGSSVYMGVDVTPVWTKLGLSYRFFTNPEYTGYPFSVIINWAPVCAWGPGGAPVCKKDEVKMLEGKLRFCA